MREKLSKIFWFPLFVYTSVLLMVGEVEIPNDDFPHEDEDDNEHLL